MCTYSRETGRLEREQQAGLLWGGVVVHGHAGHLLGGVPATTARGRHLKVLGLVDIGAARSRVKGRDEGRELSLEDKVIVPRPLTAATDIILILLLRTPSCDVNNHVT